MIYFEDNLKLKTYRRNVTTDMEEGYLIDFFQTLMTKERCTQSSREKKIITQSKFETKYNLRI